MSRKLYPVSLDPQVAKKGKKKAKEERLSFSRYVEKLIADDLENQLAEVTA